MRTHESPAETDRRWTWSWRGQDPGGLAAPLAAVALWIAVVAAVAAPLGEALARIDAQRTRPARAVAQAAPCPPPAGALASADPPRAPACRPGWAR